MNVKDIRVKRLIEFVNKNDGAAALSRKYEDIDASYLSQLINKHRPFGEKSARKLESTLGLSPNYFDTLEVEYDKSQRIMALNKIAQQLPDYALDEVINNAIKTAELIARAKAEKNGTHHQ